MLTEPINKSLSLNPTYDLLQPRDGAPDEELLLPLHLLGEGLRDLVAEDVEVLGPLALHDGPEPLYRVQLAAVGGEEQLLEVVVVDLVQLLRVMDPQVF